MLALGLPVAFCLGVVGVFFIFWQLGPNSLLLVATSSWEGWTNYVLLAIPLFVLMAYLLERSGMAEEFFETMYRWFGPIRGGLAMGTILICTIFAAMAGNSSIGTMTMGLIGLPAMLKRGYHKSIAVAAIAAGGTLGILIPPSIPMIIYSFLSQESIGKLFMGGVLPGLLMSSLFMAYIGIKCLLNPQLGPPVPKEERFTWQQKTTSLKGVILPIILVVVVLGFIYMGITTATEAAGVGAFCAFIIVIVYRRFSWKLLHDSLIGTLRITVLAGWIIFGALLFTHVFSSMGASDFVQTFIAETGINKWVVLLITQILLLFLGCFMDPTGMMIITLPIFLPVIRSLGFDPVWFGVLFTINVEMGYLTPPFGINLFYMKMLVPKGITMGDIYKSISPFIVIQAICLLIVIIFPELVLWLPEMMMGK